MRALRIGPLAAMTICAAAVELSSADQAWADQCSGLGGIGVAIGAMIGGGTAVVSSFGLPGLAVAVESSGNLNYWPGVGWTFLGASTGVGAGVAASTAFACEAGPYLPSLNGFGIGLLSTIIWAAVTPTEPDVGKPPPFDTRVSIAPLDDEGAAAVLSLGF